MKSRNVVIVLVLVVAVLVLLFQRLVVFNDGLAWVAMPNGIKLDISRTRYATKTQAIIEFDDNSKKLVYTGNGMKLYFYSTSACCTNSSQRLLP